MLVGVLSGTKEKVAGTLYAFIRLLRIYHIFRLDIVDYILPVKLWVIKVAVEVVDWR